MCAMRPQAVRRGRFVLRGAGGEGDCDRRGEVRYREIEVHGRPMPRVATALRAGHAHGGTGRLDEQVERRRSAQQLDPCGAERRPTFSCSKDV